MMFYFYYSKTKRCFIFSTLSPKKILLSGDMIPVSRKFNNLFMFHGETLEVLKNNVRNVKERKLFGELEQKLIVEVI